MTLGPFWGFLFAACQANHLSGYPIATPEKTASHSFLSCLQKIGITIRAYPITHPLYGCFQKSWYPKMDGENNGKPY